MGRRIITTQLQSTSSGAELDSYFSRVIKLIPSDVVGVWVAATGVIQSDDGAPTNFLLWITFGIGIVLTVVWTLKQTREPNKNPAITQTVVSTVSFIIWVFALGEPFDSLPFYRPLYGSLLLIFYTAVIGLINPPEG